MAKKTSHFYDPRTYHKLILLTIVFLRLTKDFTEPGLIGNRLYFQFAGVPNSN